MFRAVDNGAFNGAVDKGAFLDQLKNAHVKPIKMIRKMSIFPNLPKLFDQCMDEQIYMTILIKYCLSANADIEVISRSNTLQL